LGLKTRIPNSDVVAGARNNNLLTVPAGTDVVRLLPPLTTTAEELDVAVHSLEKACADIRAAQSAH